LKNLVYFQSSRYIIFGIYEKFGICLSKGLFEALNQIICYIAKRKQKKTGV